GHRAHGHEPRRRRRPVAGGRAAPGPGERAAAGAGAHRPRHARRPRALPGGRLRRLPAQADRREDLRARRRGRAAPGAPERRGAAAVKGEQALLEPGGRILAVDDHTRNLELVHEMLAEAGYEVVLARDGEEALAKVERELPDCIVLDIMMPRLDG